MVFFDQVSEVIDFSVAQEDYGSVFFLENVGLVRLEGGIHDGKSMKPDPGLGEGFKAGIVRATVLEFPEVSEMLGDLRFFFGEVNESPNSTHVKEI